MTLHYLLKEGFINVVFMERKENGDQPIGFMSSYGYRVKIVQDEDENNFLVGVQNCSGKIPFEVDDAIQYAISKEIHQELVKISTDRKYVPTTPKKIVNS